MERINVEASEALQGLADAQVVLSHITLAVLVAAGVADGAALLAEVRRAKEAQRTEIGASIVGQVADHVEATLQGSSPPPRPSFHVVEGGRRD